QTAALRVVATVGLLLMVLGLATLIYGPAVITLPQFLPTKTFSVTGVNVGYDQMILVAVGIVVSIGLTLVLRKTRLGMAMRGLGVGIAAAVSQRYATDFPSLLGFPPSVPFFVLFGILLSSKKGSLFEVGEVRRQDKGHLTPIPAAGRRLALLAGAAVVALVPF